MLIKILCERGTTNKDLIYMCMPKLGYAEYKISIEKFRCRHNQSSGIHQRSNKP